MRAELDKTKKIERCDNKVMDQLKWEHWSGGQGAKPPEADDIMTFETQL